MVEFGKNIFGLKKAAEYYFFKTPTQLNILESIYLVSLLPSPKRLGKSFENRKLSRNNIWRMKIILKRLYRTSKIEDDLFIYLEMLIDDSDWPFDEYSETMFDGATVMDQIFEEFDDLEEPTDKDETLIEEKETEDTDSETEPTEGDITPQEQEIDREIQSLDL